MNSGEMEIEVHAVPPFMKNGYLLTCKKSGQVAYIDPGDEVEGVLDLISRRKLDLSKILITHAHMDHICGVAQVRERWDVPIYLHKDDEPLYIMLPSQGEWFGMRYGEAPPVDCYLEEGERLHVGEVGLDVIHTPGHSPGSVSLVAEKQVFCGDLLFEGSVGRTDLPGGSFETLIESIRSKILVLGDDRTLWPGHGESTTVGRERKTNQFLIGLT